MRHVALLTATLMALAASLPAAAPVAVDVAARSLQPGEVVQLALHVAAPVEQVRVTAFGHAQPAFRVSPLEWHALIGIDLDAPVGAHDVVIDTGRPGAQENTIYRLTVRPKAFPTRRLTVAEAFVNPPPEVQDRIATEARRLEGLWAATSSAPRWTGPFVRPVTDPANSAFGSRSILNGQPRSPHGGADFLSPAGTPIHAPNAGLVALAADLYYTGNTVVIDHGMGLLSLFAHLSSIDVTEGATVTAGEVVGRVGSTGRVTGPHLHWTVRLAGARVDPLSLIAVTAPTPPSPPAVRKTK
jgi:murein DD-endopeptidase MepM/ murein hydrolase activator NlpD